jgi:hypothetical protein
VPEDAAEAWTFALRPRELPESDGIRTRSGLTTGDVLLSDREEGGREISGNPVNLASRAAQDHGEFDRIYSPDSTPPPDSRQLSFLIDGADRTVCVV